MRTRKKLEGYCLVILLLLLIFSDRASTNCNPCPPCYTGDTCSGCTYSCSSNNCETCGSGGCVSSCSSANCESCDGAGHCKVCGGDTTKCCVDGVCRPKCGGNCCPSGYLCNNGVCQPQPPSCLCAGVFEWVQDTTYQVGDKVVGSPDGWVVYECTSAHTATAETRPTSGGQWSSKWKVNLNLEYLMVTISGRYPCYDTCFRGCYAYSQSAEGGVNGFYFLRWVEPCGWSVDFVSSTAYTNYNSNDCSGNSYQYTFPNGNITVSMNEVGEIEVTLACRNAYGDPGEYFHTIASREGLGRCIECTLLMDECIWEWSEWCNWPDGGYQPLTNWGFGTFQITVIPAP